MRRVKRNLAQRILLAATIPLVTVTALVVYHVYVNYSAIQRAKEVKSITQVLPALADVVQNLQRERGRSVGYIASFGSEFGAELAAQRRATDLSIAEFRRARELGNQAVLSEADRRFLSDLSQSLSSINNLRSLVGALNGDQRLIIERYTDVIRGLFSIMDYLSKYVREYDLKSAINAANSIMHMKDYVGLQRAYGSVILANELAAPSAYSKYSKLSGRKEQSAEAFEKSAGPDKSGMIDIVFDEAIRYAAMEQAFMDIALNASPPQYTADEWFSVSTAVIDRLSNVEAEAIAHVEFEAQKIVDDGKVLVSLYLFIGTVTVIVAGFAALATIKSLKRQLKLSREVRLLAELNEWLQISNSLEELFASCRPYIETLLPDTDGAMYIYSNSRDVLDGVATWGEGKVHAHIRAEDCWALRKGRPHYYGFGKIGFRCAHDEHSEEDRPSACFPILADGETIGLMHLKLKQGGNKARFMESMGVTRMCAEQMALAISNVQLRNQLHFQSMRDPLTGLYNRRYLMDCMVRLTRDSAQTDEVFSVISIDVDHFKAFNDTYGHDAGDAVLREIANVFMEETKGSEAACRNGGEEFVLLWPGVPLEQSVERANDLRERVENHQVVYNGGRLPKVTISIGIAAYQVHGTGVQELMKRADDALYDAKHAGRNCVKTAVAPKMIEASQPESGNIVYVHAGD